MMYDTQLREDRGLIPKEMLIGHFDTPQHFSLLLLAPFYRVGNI